MFVGMSFCLPIGWFMDYYSGRKTTDTDETTATEPLLADVSNITHGLLCMRSMCHMCNAQA